jgi:transcriptional regulator GlxA family with amidase domain
MSTRTVAVVAYNDINPFLLSVPCMVFAGVRFGAEPPGFDLLTCSAEGGTLRSGAGFGILAEHGLEGLERADIVVVPSWRDADELPPTPLLEALVAAHGRGALVVGLCLGSYVLAAAGLLENRPATTHWNWAHDLARRYPSVRVRPDVLYLDDGDVITSAGVAAGIDCCLHILRRFHGAEVANRVARRMVVPPHRQGGQSQYIEQPLPVKAACDSFSNLLEWLQANLDQPHGIDSLAERVMMSRRTFTRRFRQATGTTVGAWLLNQRLVLVQRLLETSSAPLEMIAQQAGFGSAVSLRQHFSAAFHTTPSRYRREFRRG